MKRKIIALLALMSVLVLLTGCFSKNTDIKDELRENISENKKEEKESDDGQMIVEDNERIKIAFLGIERHKDKYLNEERYEVKFQVENKMDKNIEVQARSVAADGKMINDSMATMSQEVKGGKTAEAVLIISDFGEGSLPVIENELELTLHIFDWDDIEYTEDFDLKIKL